MKIYNKFILTIIFTLFIISLSSCEINGNQSINNSIKQTQEIISKVNISSVGVSDFKNELAKNDSILIDLRTTEELKDTGILPGAKQIDYYVDNFKNTLESLDKNQKYLIYCRSGNRSEKTLLIMKKLGFTNVIELNSGINSWLQSGEKTEEFN